jgi:hypothetical protein
MNLAVAVRDASMEAVKATQASVTHERKDRLGTPAFAGAAAGFGAAGFTGVTGADGVATTVELLGAGSLESSLLIGISQGISH